MPTLSSAKLIPVGAAAVLTGICALIQELIWVRQATLAFGLSVQAYAAVVVALLGGTALGSWLFARAMGRIHRPLLWFAGMQVILAGLALLTLLGLAQVRHLYAALAPGLGLEQGFVQALRLGLSVAVLSPIALLAGGSLPLLGRWAGQQDTQRGSVLVGRLYAWETVGAAVGCGGTALILLRMLPAGAAIWLAAGLHIVAGLLALWTHRTVSTETTGASTFRRSGGTSARSGQHRRGTWLLVAYGVSGAVALGYQVVWGRVLAVFTLDAVYSFAIVLTVFLMGLSIGSGMAARRLRRHQPSLAGFGHLQLWLAALGLATVFLFYLLPLVAYEDLFGTYRLGRAILFEFLLAVFILLPPTCLMGYLWPIVQHLAAADTDGNLGVSTGRVNAVNTLGAVAGVLATTFGLIPTAGLQGSLFLLATGSLLLGLAALVGFSLRVADPIRNLRWPAAAAVLLLIGFVLRPPAVYLGFRQDPGEFMAFYAEGVDTTVAVFDVPESNIKVSFVNGRIEVPTDAISMQAFRALGHLPPLVREGAQSALMLSFGNGIATGSLDGHGIPHVDAVDLSREMLDAAEVYWEENHNVLHSPRVSLHVEDGRNFLLRTPHRYDIITADATHPANTSSWALFTHEFYESVANRLVPDGVFFQWLPFHSMSEEDFRLILRTFRTTFPHTVLWYTGGSHSIVMATPEPFGDADLQVLLARIDDMPRAREDLGGSAAVAVHFALDAEQLAAYVGEGDIVRDRQVFFAPVADRVIEIAESLAVAGSR